MAFEDENDDIPVTVDGDELNKIHTKKFLINPSLWEDIDQINDLIDTTQIQKIKYMNEDMDKYDDEVNDLPTNKGGIYFFFIKTPFLNDMINYLVYIGRAKCTDKQNIKKRCREYYYDYANIESKKSARKRKVNRMIKRWGKYLYFHYYELEDNDLIISLETLLINNIRPPFNSSIPKKIQYNPPVPAFGATT